MWELSGAWPPCGRTLALPPIFGWRRLEGGAQGLIDYPVWEVWEADTTRALFPHGSVSGSADATRYRHLRNTFKDTIGAGTLVTDWGQAPTELAQWVQRLDRVIAVLHAHLAVARRTRATLTAPPEEGGCSLPSPGGPTWLWHQASLHVRPALPTCRGLAWVPLSRGPRP